MFGVHESRDPFGVSHPWAIRMPDNEIIKKTIERGRQYGTRRDDKMEFRGEVIQAWREYGVSLSMSQEFDDYRVEVKQEKLRTIGDMALEQLHRDHPNTRMFTLVDVNITKYADMNSLIYRYSVTFTFSTAEILLMVEEKPHLFI